MRDRNQHKQKHDGDWRNPTEGELIDRNSRLGDVNNNRVWKNELSGIGLAAAIGLGVGFTISVATTLAQHGVSVDSLKQAMGIGLKVGTETSVLSTITHSIVRGMGESISNSIAQIGIDRFGMEATKNLFKMCQLGVVGAISSIVFSTWVFVKLKYQGYEFKYAISKAAKSLSYSLGILFISIMAQGLWGGHAGIIVSISIGVFMITYHVIKKGCGRMLYERFVTTLKNKDDRNEFAEKLDTLSVLIPKELQDFYKEVNPIDVEVTLKDLTSVKFFSLKELTDIEKEYNMEQGSYVFASREGDPIIIKNGKVYTATHGSTTWELEHLCDGFDDFIH